MWTTFQDTARSLHPLQPRFGRRFKILTDSKLLVVTLLLLYSPGRRAQKGWAQGNGRYEISFSSFSFFPLTSCFLRATAGRAARKIRKASGRRLKISERRLLHPGSAKMWATLKIVTAMSNQVVGRNLEKRCHGLRLLKTPFSVTRTQRRFLASTRPPKALSEADALKVAGSLFKLHCYPFPFFTAARSPHSPRSNVQKGGGSIVWLMKRIVVVEREFLFFLHLRRPTQSRVCFGSLVGPNELGLQITQLEGKAWNWTFSLDLRVLLRRLISHHRIVRRTKHRAMIRRTLWFINGFVSEPGCVRFENVYLE